VLDLADAWGWQVEIAEHAALLQREDEPRFATRARDGGSRRDLARPRCPTRDEMIANHGSQVPIWNRMAQAIFS
jgi:hypothetical protein